MNSQNSNVLVDGLCSEGIARKISHHKAVLKAVPPLRLTYTRHYHYVIKVIVHLTSDPYTLDQLFFHPQFVR